jgi:hypothetical protein
MIALRPSPKCLGAFFRNLSEAQIQAGNAIDSDRVSGTHAGCGSENGLSNWDSAARTAISAPHEALTGDGPWNRAVNCFPGRWRESHREGLSHYWLWEPLGAWRQYARVARATLNLMAALREERSGRREDWLGPGSAILLAAKAEVHVSRALSCPLPPRSTVFECFDPFSN